MHWDSRIVKTASPHGSTGEETLSLVATNSKPTAPNAAYPIIALAYIEFLTMLFAADRY